MPVQLTIAPATEPITLQEAKDHLRLETALDDTYLGTVISAARKHIEEVCWRGVVTQQWKLVLPSFGSERNRCDEFIRLPHGNLAPLADLLAIDPALSPVPTSPVISVKYIDVNGAEQTLATTEYDVDTVDVPGRLRLAHGKSWPATRDQWNAVTITYWVGWSVATVPAPIKQAVLLLVGQMYEQRVPEVVGTSVSEVRFAVDALLAPYRLNTIG